MLRRIPFPRSALQNPFGHPDISPEASFEIPKVCVCGPQDAVVCPDSQCQQLSETSTLPIDCRAAPRQAELKRLSCAEGFISRGREAFWEKLSRGFPNRGVSHFILGQGLDCVADPFGTVPRRYVLKKDEQEERDKSGGKSPNNPRAHREIPENRESTKKDKKGRASPDRDV